jgi:hypothetical protein
MFFSFKTVSRQPLSHPKQIRAGEYAGGRKISLERVKAQVLRSYEIYSSIEILPSSEHFLLKRTGMKAKIKFQNGDSL